MLIAVVAVGCCWLLLVAVGWGCRFSCLLLLLLVVVIIVVIVAVVAVIVAVAVVAVVAPWLLLFVCAWLVGWLVVCL